MKKPQGLSFSRRQLSEHDCLHEQQEFTPRPSFRLPLAPCDA